MLLKSQLTLGEKGAEQFCQNSLQTACLNCWRCQRWLNAILIAYFAETLFGGVLEMRTDWLVKIRLMSSSVDTCKRGVTLSISYKLVDPFLSRVQFQFHCNLWCVVAGQIGESTLNGIIMGWIVSIPSENADVVESRMLECWLKSLTLICLIFKVLFLIKILIAGK